MSETLRLSGYREPLGLWVRPAARVDAGTALGLREIEYASRGDRVPGHVLLPAEGAGPHPLVMLQADPQLATRNAVETLGAGWAERGAAVASIDLPLHGARADQKLLSLLTGGGEVDAAPWRAALARELARQAVIDLERALDALCTLTWIDAARIAYVGFGPGARLGAAFAALDPRVAAAVLAPEAGGLELPGTGEVADWIARIAPRPVLLLRARASRAGAAPAGVECLDFDVASDGLPAAAAEAVGRFLAGALGG